MNSRKLIVGIDIGTTYSAVSFCFLPSRLQVRNSRHSNVALAGNDPYGEKIEQVLRWSKQGESNAKVPSVAYYDQQGNLKMIGAATEDEQEKMLAELNGWNKVEWWKLYLQPEHLRVKALELANLPPSVSCRQIFTDFFKYILTELQEYISSTHAEGVQLWDSSRSTMQTILTCPNGWEMKQHNTMRQAAIDAGFTDAATGSRVRFVTESEAAVLYVAKTGCIQEWLKADESFIVCDCGGGTIDITGYTIKSVEPLQLEECTTPACYAGGAVVVTQRAQSHLQDLFDSESLDPENSSEVIDIAVADFERNAKKKFNSDSGSAWVRLDGFGNNKKLGITRGRLEIPGPVVAGFFEYSLSMIQEGIKRAFEESGEQVNKVILVGGLSSSPYIYSMLLKWGFSRGITIMRPAGSLSKVVPEGALLAYIQDSVVLRISPFYYGVSVYGAYDAKKPSHQTRPFTVDINEQKNVEDLWWPLVHKNQRVPPGEEFFASFVRRFAIQATNNFIVLDPIYVYRGDTPPEFVYFSGGKQLQTGVEVLCTLKTDLRKPFGSAATLVSDVTRKRYKEVKYDIGIKFLESEIQTRMRWKNESAKKWIYGDSIAVPN